jgi:hypothetical protein
MVIGVRGRAVKEFAVGLAKVSSNGGACLGRPPVY